MIELLLYPLITGLGLALISGPLGTFMVWRRMAFFGDTVAHGALVGVAVGILLQIHSTLAIVLAALISAMILAALKMNKSLPTDTLLSIISHGSLAVGLTLVSMLANQRINLMGILLGDILTTTLTDAVIIFCVAVAGIAIIVRHWRALVLSVVEENLAEAEGHNTKRLNMLLTIVMAVTIAMAVKIVGVLLVTALMIIPAATSRLISKSPESMAALASCIGMLATLLGLALSAILDVPTGPAMVSAALLIFFLTSTIQVPRGDKIN